MVGSKHQIDSPVDGWNSTRYWGFIRSALRKAFAKYPPRYQTVAASKGGRNQYVCASCGQVYGKKDVAVDHITPCGTLRKYSDLPSFVERLFCGREGLQVLCKSCHYTKTMYERGMTDADIAVAKFRRLPAKEQKKLVDGSNQEIRIKQYRELL